MTYQEFIKIAEKVGCFGKVIVQETSGKEFDAVLYRHEDIIDDSRWFICSEEAQWNGGWYYEAAATEQEFAWAISGKYDLSDFVSIRPKVKFISEDDF